MFFFQGFFYPSAFFFHLDISQNGLKVILFESYQGEGGALYSFKACQALIFISVIDTRYYETDDLNNYATALISFAFHEKAE